MIPTLLSETIALWESIPWVADRHNRFKDMPAEIQQALATFGTGLRRLQNEIENTVFDDHEKRNAELLTSQTNLEQQIRILQAEIHRLQVSNQLIGQKEQQSHQRLLELESQVDFNQFSQEQLTKLEGQIVQLQRLNDTLLARNTELENLLEREKAFNP